MGWLSYDHAVVYNGKFYPANTPVEAAKEEKAVKSNADKRTSGKTKSANTTG